MIKKIILAAALSAALIGQAFASTELGLKYFNQGYTLSAQNKFKKPADAGDPVAQYYWVILSTFGEKTLADIQKYGPYMRHSAESGFPYAMWVLGDYGNCKKYDSCSEIQMWRDKALAKWKQMAEKGDQDAAYYYAYYATGQDDDRNTRMKKLALKGNWRAAKYLYDDWNTKNSDSKLTREDFVKLFTPAAQQNNPLAMARLGLLELKLNPDKKALKKIQSLFLKALDLGFYDAAYNLWDFYAKWDKNPEQSYYYLAIGETYKGNTLRSSDGKLLSDKKKSELKAKAEAFVKAHPPQAFPPIIDTTFLSRDYYGGLSETWDKYFG